MQDNNPAVNNSNQAPITTPPTPVSAIPAPVVPAFQEQPQVVMAPTPMVPEKKSPLVKIAVILLVLALLGVSGYFAYQMLMPKSVTPEEMMIKEEVMPIETDVPMEYETPTETVPTLPESSP